MPTPMEIADYVARRAQYGSNFYTSMQTTMETRGTLSERQLACVLDDMAKDANERNPFRQDAPALRGAVVRIPPAARERFDLSTIMAMFERASQKLKVPAYRAAGLVLTRAKPESANPGCIYVKRESGGQYLGKITAEGEFRQVKECDAMDVDNLREIEAAPGEAAVKWGRLTGRCSCCGLPLSDPKSIERGIGPICAENWGL